MRYAVFLLCVSMGKNWLTFWEDLPEPCLLAEWRSAAVVYQKWPIKEDITIKGDMTIKGNVTIKGYMTIKGNVTTKGTSRNGKNVLVFSSFVPPWPLQHSSLAVWNLHWILYCKQWTRKGFASRSIYVVEGLGFNSPINPILWMPFRPSQVAMRLSSTHEVTEGLLIHLVWTTTDSEQIWEL